MATIAFQGNPIHTCGELPIVGNPAPDFALTDGNLTEVTLASYRGKRKVLNIAPSLDTPICAASARMFNQKAANFANTVILLVSADLPFAQCRFCTSEGLQHIVPLSSFRSRFADDYGVRITDGLLMGLSARAIVVIAENDTVIYHQWVKELTEEPDYSAVIAALSA